jgi:hypothetical protein
MDSENLTKGNCIARGYTLGLHQKLLACSKALFYGAFSKPFYYGGEGGILSSSPEDLENGSKMSVFRTT